MDDNRNKTVLCIGISVLDIIARPVGAAQRWREKQQIESIRLMAGGDAANQSIHLASLGYHAMFNGCVGSDPNGKTVIAALSDRGVDVSLVRIKADVPTGTALLLVGEEGERHIFSVHGAHSTLSGEDLPAEVPKGCRAVSLGSLFGMPLAEADGLEAFLEKAKAGGIPVFADLDSGRVVPNLEGMKHLLPYIDYFLPSYYDVLPMTGEAALEDAVKKLQSLGVGDIIVKCGADGAGVYGASFTGNIPAVKVAPIDTTGAGDCMSAAFISRIIEGDDLESAVRYACAAGSLCTLYPGANSVVLSDREIRRMLAAC